MAIKNIEEFRETVSNLERLQSEVRDVRDGISQYVIDHQMYDLFSINWRKISMIHGNNGRHIGRRRRRLDG